MLKKASLRRNRELDLAVSSSGETISGSEASDFSNLDQEGLADELGISHLK